MIANNLTPYEPTHPGEFLREEMKVGVRGAIRVSPG